MQTSAELSPPYYRNLPPSTLVCSRGQKSVSTSHHNVSFPDIPLPWEIIDRSSGWETPAGSLSWCPVSHLTMFSCLLFSLSISLLHQPSRVPALLKGRPSKTLTGALQQLVVVSWCVICRESPKGRLITWTTMCVDVLFSLTFRRLF